MTIEEITGGVLKCSPEIKHEYCCTVVRIGECSPIEGADRIQKTLVNGLDMVISKEIKQGDIMVYAMNETRLSSKFLRENNLYGIDFRELNANYAEVEKVIAEQGKDAAKPMCGFFTKQDRVKLIKLKGTFSFGFLFGPKLLEALDPSVANVDFSQCVDMDFDTVGDELLVKAYVPLTTGKRCSGGAAPQAVKGRKDRLVEGSFVFHYDSGQLQRYIDRVKPDDIVDISVKMHGTSAVIAKTLTHVPLKLNVFKKAWNGMAKRLNIKGRFAETADEQGVVYSSRTVIKNRWATPDSPYPKYGDDLWGRYASIIGPLLDDETCVYGEIVGYMPDDVRCIQKNYDYGLEIGKNRFMPYRVVRTSNGRREELSVCQVVEWTVHMKNQYPDILSDVLLEMPVLYHGTLRDLYDTVPVDEHWHANVLEKMKRDVNVLGMETDEVMCRNKVPREGVCLRIEGDPVLENFKLKCVKFLNKESKAMDAGEVDIEMIENDY